MPKPRSKQTKRHEIIVNAVSVGMSGNKISKLLREQGLGVRNKKLYEEIRSVKGETISKEKSKKSIPKKYRKKDKGSGFGKIGMIYRGSLIISSVPLHSRPFDRHYLGFRLNIFSIDRNTVYRSLRDLRRMFIKKVGNYVKSFQYAQDQVMGIENPTKITVNFPERLNNKWFFAVEEKGRDILSEDGYI